MRLLLAPKVRASGGGAKDQAFHAPENAAISWARVCTHLRRVSSSIQFSLLSRYLMRSKTSESYRSRAVIHQHASNEESTCTHLRRGFPHTSSTDAVNDHEFFYSGQSLDHRGELMRT